jgi:hypothetical protein
MKKVIRLTEGDLHNIVKESVQRILNEIGDTPKGQFALGAVKGRSDSRDFFGGRASKTAQDAPKIAKKHRDNKQDWYNMSNRNASMSPEGSETKKYWEKKRQNYSDEFDNMSDSYNKGVDYGIKKGSSPTQNKRF